MPRPKTPALTADCVVVDARNRVLLVPAQIPAIQSRQYACPAASSRSGETVEDACREQLMDGDWVEAGKLQLLGVYSDPNRPDPRDTPAP